MVSLIRSCFSTAVTYPCASIAVTLGTLSGIAGIACFVLSGKYETSESNSDFQIGRILVITGATLLINSIVFIPITLANCTRQSRENQPLLEA